MHASHNLAPAVEKLLASQFSWIKSLIRDRKTTDLSLPAFQSLRNLSISSVVVIQLIQMFNHSIDNRELLLTSKKPDQLTRN